MTRVLVFAGSVRQASWNKRLAGYAAEQARGTGVDVTLVDLAALPMPLYDGDLEEREGIPENVLAMQRLMLEHDAFLIACPEYNGSITPLLKNVIDWTSRPSAVAAGTQVTRGKVVGLLSASPGALGGMRGLVHVRAILSGIGAHVVPGDAAVGRVHEAFADDGSFTDERTATFVNGLVAKLVETAAALTAS